MKGRMLAYAVVDIRLPANGLFRNGLPADKDVKGRLAFEDGDEAFLQLQAGRQAIFGAALPALYANLVERGIVQSVTYRVRKRVFHRLPRELVPERSRDDSSSSCS